jgi:hypothetical protein
MIQPRVIAIDFDGTCVAHDFPNIGHDIGAVPVLKDLVAAGHKLILWTMRSDGRESELARNGQPMNSNVLTEAIEWANANGVAFAGINNNPGQITWTSSPKAYAHLYIDDAALGAPLRFNSALSDRPFICWVTVREMLVRQGYLIDEMDEPLGERQQCAVDNPGCDSCQ